jgi:hypothetical protein
MSFDALTIAGLFTAAVSGGFFIALATRTGITQIRNPAPTRADDPSTLDTGR